MRVVNEIFYSFINISRIPDNGKADFYLKDNKEMIKMWNKQKQQQLWQHRMLHFHDVNSFVD